MINTSFLKYFCHANQSQAQAQRPALAPQSSSDRGLHRTRGSWGCCNAWWQLHALSVSGSQERNMGMAILLCWLMLMLHIMRCPVASAAVGLRTCPAEGLSDPVPHLSWFWASSNLEGRATVQLRWHNFAGIRLWVKGSGNCELKFLIFSISIEENEELYQHVLSTHRLRILVWCFKQRSVVEGLFQLIKLLSHLNKNLCLLSFSVCRIPCRIFCSGGFVVIYCFSFCLLYKTFIVPSILNGSFPGQCTLGLKLFSFSAQNTSLYALLVLMFLLRNLLWIWWVYFFMLFVSITAFNILSLFSVLVVLIIWHGEVTFWSSLFGVPKAFCTSMGKTFSRF
jgi:hypothetical protein